MSDNLSEDKKNYHNRQESSYKKIFEEAAVAEKSDYVIWIAKRMNIVKNCFLPKLDSIGSS